MSEAALATVPKPRDAGSVRETLLSNRRALADATVGRGKVFAAIDAAALARQNVFLLGPPGVAKSYAVRLWTKQLHDARYGEMLLSRHTAESDVLAHKDLPALMNEGIDRWLTDGKVTECDVAFLDEVFKASGALLNGLLAWLNERLVKGHIESPTRFVVAASNETPRDPSLGALYDRFTVRLNVEPLQGDADRVHYLRSAADGKIRQPKLANVSLRDLDTASAAAEGLPITNETISAIVKLQRELTTVGVYVSDRAARQSLSLCRAYAFLEGAPEVWPEHCEVLENAFWHNADQAEAVRKAVGRVAASAVAEIRNAVEDALREFYVATQACDLKSGTWSDDAAKANFASRAPEFVEQTKRTAEEMRSKFKGKIPDRLRARAQPYMKELRDAFEFSRAACKLDTP